MSSNDLCKACTLLEGLERGLANVAVVRTKSYPFVHGSSFTYTFLHARRQIEGDGRWMLRALRPPNYGLSHSSSYLRVQLLQQYRQRHRDLSGQLSIVHHVSICTQCFLIFVSSRTPCIVIVISPISHQQDIALLRLLSGLPFCRSLPCSKNFLQSSFTIPISVLLATDIRCEVDTIRNAVVQSNHTITPASPSMENKENKVLRQPSRRSYQWALCVGHW